MNGTISTSSEKRATAGKSVVRLVLKVAVFSAIVVPVFYLLVQHLNEMDRTQIAASMRSIPLQAIALSGLFTAISLYGVARYDLLAMKQLGYRVPKRRSIQGGFVAVSIGQTLGFGLLVGAFARWRFYREYGVGLKDAGLISALVAGGFLIGFAIILTITVLIDPTGLATMTGFDLFEIKMAAFAGLFAFGLVLLLSLSQSALRVGTVTLRAPKLKVLQAQVMLAAVDVIPAAAALWVLLPAEGGPSLMLVIPVYLTALGVGLVSNTPGGLGVLELACLMALPVMPPEQLVAALIVYRGIYFGVPAIIAVAMLVARELFASSKQELVVECTKTIQDQVVARILQASARAEAQLALLGDKEFVISDCGRGMLMFGASGNSLVAMGDPIGPVDTWINLQSKFEEEATSRMMVPSYYKVGDTFRSLLALSGQFATQIASEAIVDVATFSTEGSSKRELRRKLKAAGKAGVEIKSHAPGEAPMGLFAQISRTWSAAKGGERGFSMGYFDPDYLGKYKCLEAVVGRKSLGFVSLWTSGDGTEWSLDVMRLSDDTPDGTMHALVAAAIEAARDAGAERFSLCAVPFAGIETPQNVVERLLAYIYTEKPKLHASTGLYRFKNAFRPEWVPIYGVSPNLATSLLGALDVHKLIKPVVREAEDVGDVIDIADIPQELAA